MRYIIFILVLVGCGQQYSMMPTKDDSIVNKVNKLQVISDTLSAMVYSDFSTCPNSGDTADALIRKMCQVAKASTVEAMVELKSELGAFVTSLQEQINVINNELVTKQVSIDTINAQISTINSSLLSLDSRMTSAESAIVALQSLTSSISGSLNGTLMAIDIGSENVLAGPLYESVLRRLDRQKFTGYVKAYSNPIGLGSNPMNATNGSSIVTVTTPSAHGYSVNDRVEFDSLVGSRGFSNGHVFGTFTILTVPTSTTFTVSLLGTATSGGSLGGSSGTVTKVIGEGMGTLWSAGQVSDTSVRVSNLGSKRYNFIIRRKASDLSNNIAELCYDKTNNTANFATINASPEGGSGNIVCK